MKPKKTPALKPRLDLPDPTQYWESPPRQSQGDGSPNDLFLAVGKTLSEWEEIELVHSWFFGLFVAGDAKGPMTHIARRSYGMLATSRGRQDLLAEASKGFFSFQSAADDRDDFAWLLKHFVQASPIRNYVAHGLVTEWKFENKSVGYFLEPPDYSSLKTDFQKRETFPGQDFSPTKVTYRYTSSQVLEIESKFSNIKKAALGLWKVFSSKYGPGR